MSIGTDGKTQKSARTVDGVGVEPFKRFSKGGMLLL